MPTRFKLSQADFAQLRALRPHRTHGTFFSLTVYTLPSSIRGPRAAAVISKKMVPKAVMRNLIERRFREVVRASKGGLLENRAYIFHAKKDIKQADYKDIIKDIKTLFERSASGGTMHRL